MDLANMLDYAIKQKEKGTGKYTVKEKRSYDRYMDNKSWEFFVDEMKNSFPLAYTQFSEGSGKELNQIDKNGRPCVPKMACYGSSSRMIYMFSRNIDGFVFEKKLSTRVGGTAHLDGWLEKEDKHIFVEAKCREPYLEKSRVSKAYRELYSYISSKTQLKIETAPYGQDKIDAKFYSQGKEIKHFDMKQMICHLLGIANGILSGRLSKKKIDFLYLIYDPTGLSVSRELLEIYNITVREGESVDFKELFSAVIGFLISKGVENKSGCILDLHNLLSFKICSQNDYTTEMEK